MEKYTPKLASETREWIEEALGEKLQAGDLLEALKDGTALCKYVYRLDLQTGRIQVVV